VFINVTRDRPRITTGVLAGGLVLCAVAQAAALDYGFKRELNGTAERPGGIALSEDSRIDRETWLDDRLPEGEQAAVVPGVPTAGIPFGGTERLQFWNRELDTTVLQGWNGAVSPTPPGYAHVVTTLGNDGLVRWTPQRWFAAHPDDPRVQFQGKLVARSPVSPYALYRAGDSDRAVWTSVGLESDGAVLRGGPVTMTLDRRAAGNPRSVVVSLQAPVGTRSVRWTLTGRGRTVSAGRLKAGQTRSLRVPVPACPAANGCRPLSWTLRASGRPVGAPIPAFGPPGPLRPVVLMVAAARIG